MAELSIQGCVPQRERQTQQVSKGWYWTAIAIGSLVLVGGVGIGITGLLQSHHVISLPKHMASAIGTLSSAPHNWGLWTLTVGSFAVGAVGIVYGAYKIHKIKDEEAQQLIQRWMIHDPTEDARTEIDTVSEEELRATNRCLESFGDHFASMRLNKDDDEFTMLEPGEFTTMLMENDQSYIVRRPHSSPFNFPPDRQPIECTKLLLKTECKLVFDALKTRGYRYSSGIKPGEFIEMVLDNGLHFIMARPFSTPGTADRPALLSANNLDDRHCRNLCEALITLGYLQIDP